MDVSEINAIADWLVDGARSAPQPSQMMVQSCRRMVAAGLPLWRVGVFIRTLHPEIFGRNFIWREGADEVEVGTVDFEIQETPEFKRSPLSLVFNQGLEIRGNPNGPDVERFPFLEDLKQEGATDYIAMPMRFLDGLVNAISWTTKQPGGFGEEQVAAMRALTKPLTRMTEIITLRRTATTLLDTYVGNRAGERIMDGQIRRGHADIMQAVIWLSDLRGFTALSDRLPAETVVEILNHYFDCQVASIRAHGGEVLKFMGDGLLAVFPIDEYVGDANTVCSHALAAACEARTGVDELAFPIGDTIERFRFGVALHVGNVLYGNVGGGNRLDFTCIGPAINLAARLEKIAGRVGRTVVASESFVRTCAAPWRELGEFPIAGLAKAARVYGLADEVPAANFEKQPHAK